MSPACIKKIKREIEKRVMAEGEIRKAVYSFAVNATEQWQGEMRVWRNLKELRSTEEATNCNSFSSVNCEFRDKVAGPAKQTPVVGLRSGDWGIFINWKAIIYSL